MTHVEHRFGTPLPRVETPTTGLTDAEVRERVAQGLTNDGGDRTSRTYGEIIRANVFTRFNAILGTMLVIVLAVGHFPDALFGIILVVNSLIGIVQEVRGQAHARPARGARRATRARRARRRRARAARSRRSCSTTSSTCAPATRCRPTASCSRRPASRSTSRCSRASPTPSTRRPATRCCRAASSSPASGRFQATRVGAEAYARQLATEARRFTLARSELVDGINTLLRYIQYALFPVADRAPAAPAGARTTASPRRSSRWSPPSSAWSPRASSCSRASRSASPR